MINSVLFMSQLTAQQQSESNRYVRNQERKKKTLVPLCKCIALPYFERYTLQSPASQRGITGRH